MAETNNTKPWNWETVKKLTLELDTQADEDIIRQLESQESPGEYLKRIIREDMAKRVDKTVIPGINPDDVVKAEKNFDAILNMLKNIVSK